jgi:hypothetical protein
MAPRSTLPRPPRRHNRRRHRRGITEEGIDRVRTPGKGRPEQGPVAGTMDRVRPHRVQRRHMAIARLLDWPADPCQTPSGGGHRADPGQKRDTGGRMGLETLYGTRREGVRSLPGYPRVALPATALKDATRRQDGGLKAILDRGRRQRRR